MPESALGAMEAEQDRYLKPTGLGLLTHGKTGRITALVALLTLLAAAVLWLLASARKRKLPIENQPS